MSKKNVPRSEEFRERMRVIAIGRTRSPETRARMSAAKLGVKKSDATRAAMSKAAQARHARERAAKESKVIENDHGND